MGMLDGKTALVTGAGRGIGRGIAIALAEAGAKVVVNDLGASLAGEGDEKGPADQVVDEIMKAGGTAAANYGSVADFGQAAAMVEQAVDAWGRIDILVQRGRHPARPHDLQHDRGRVGRRHRRPPEGHVQHAPAPPPSTCASRRAAASSTCRRCRRSARPGSPTTPRPRPASSASRGRRPTRWRKYGVTANAIMPSGATRMIDSTPRGRAVFEQTGKWPSEQAVGTERDPDNVAPLVVYLASDAAAHVNGQVFHSFGYGYTLLAQPQAVRRLEADRRLDPDELAKLFPKTLGADLKPPPARLRPDPRRAARRASGRTSAAACASGSGRGRSADASGGEDRPDRLPRQHRPQRDGPRAARADAGRARRGRRASASARAAIANYARDGMLPSLDARLVLREEGIHLAEDGLTSTDLSATAICSRRPT